ncbi:uncharacterized protein G2W53_003667 [Senna tora]|uniref:Uncharacterized protein n=1 Tax=Senna tora TaxID=362788 RepID=A0A834XBX4_9FABA|nr:uncharacterized protein G2W53_003667 [Senna tora]
MRSPHAHIGLLVAGEASGKRLDKLSFHHSVRAVCGDMPTLINHKFPTLRAPLELLSFLSNMGLRILVEVGNCILDFTCLFTIFSSQGLPFSLFCETSLLLHVVSFLGSALCQKAALVMACVITLAENFRDTVGDEATSNTMQDKE